MPKQKPHRSKQDYGTPDDFLTAAKKLLKIDNWDIDLAASVDNTVTTRYYDDAMNALEQSWICGNGWNWLNPPFGMIAKFVEKAWREWSRYQARTAVLIPASVGANWWADSVHNKARVLFLQGRLVFKGTPINPKTGKPDPYPKDCALLLYGGGDGPGYSVWDWKNNRFK